MIPTDVRNVILSYLPLIKLEELIIAKKLATEDLISVNLLRYNNDPAMIRHDIGEHLDKKSLPIPFTLLTYNHYALHTGEIGYYGHLITKVKNCCILAIKNGNFALVKHYLYLLKYPEEELNSITNGSFIELLAILAHKEYVRGPNAERKKITAYLCSFASRFVYSFNSVSLLLKYFDGITDANFVILRLPGNSHDSSLLSALQFLDLQMIKEVFKLTPQKVFPEVIKLSYNYLLLTKEKICECKQIYEFICNNWEYSPARDSYLTLLNIVLDNDFDLNNINSSLLTYVIMLAYSLCISRINKLTILRQPVPFVIPSEVIYSINSYKIVYTLVDDIDNLELSMWLAGNFKYMLETDDWEICELIEYFDQKRKFDFTANYQPQVTILEYVLELKALGYDIFSFITPANYFEYLRMRKNKIEVDFDPRLLESQTFYNNGAELFAVISNEKN